MRRISLTFTATAAALLIGTSSASAFSEVDTAPNVPGVTVSEAPEGLNTAPGAGGQSNLPALQMIDPSSASPSRNEGTPLSIPGIGYIGTLPKLDFGLELLYGAPTEPEFEVDRSPSNSVPTGQPEEDDVIIRGTLKHRF